MKVCDLIALLGRYDPDAEVITTWEGTVHLVTDDNVYASADGIVLINADDNDGKERDLIRNLAGEVERMYRYVAED
jgi:hypothetical protein